MKKRTNRIITFLAAVFTLVGLISFARHYHQRHQHLESHHCKKSELKEGKMKVGPMDKDYKK